MDNEIEMSLEYFENELRKILPIVENNKKVLEKLYSKNQTKQSVKKKIENLSESISIDERMIGILNEAISQLKNK